MSRAAGEGPHRSGKYLVHVALEVRKVFAARRRARFERTGIEPGLEAQPLDAGVARLGGQFEHRRIIQQRRAKFPPEKLTCGSVFKNPPQGPPAGWDEQYVSAYATMHPAEDWAETFAHYLHIRSTLDTAAAM